MTSSPALFKSLLPRLSCGAGRLDKVERTPVYEEPGGWYKTIACCYFCYSSNCACLSASKTFNRLDRLRRNLLLWWLLILFHNLSLQCWCFRLWVLIRHMWITTWLLNSMLTARILSGLKLLAVHAKNHLFTCKELPTLVTWWLRTGFLFGLRQSRLILTVHF